jgi:multiple sugar transport system substrate-binding protein
MKTHRAASALLVTLLCAGASRWAGAEEAVTLTFVWHAGDRAELLRKISEQYTRETGVRIAAILPPMNDAWHDRIAEEFAKKGSAFDLCIFDSQSMAEFASQGHVVRLNDLLAKSQRVRAGDFDPSALRRYAEYPDGSGNIYALPINQDSMGLVYRRDLFESPEERAGFRQRYGYDLKIPETYQQLRDAAEFFTRPKEQLYGLALYGSEDYDAASSAFDNVFWSFGAELWDPASGRAEGYVNSEPAKKALTFFKQLFVYAPPGASEWYVREVNEAVETGRVAMAFQWYYFFDELARATAGGKPRLGFAALPGQIDGQGRLRRFLQVGGQGVSINRYSRYQKEAWSFLEWFMSEEQQWKWVEGGGKTGLARILHDPRFLRSGVANDSFPMSMRSTKDYWHLAQYPALLRIYQKAIHDAVVGRASPDHALDDCAREQEKVLRAARTPRERQATE